MTTETPIDMVLHCPACGTQHIDAPEEPLKTAFDPNGVLTWTNPPHRSHLCHECGHVWRPADVPTNGVAAVKTKGKADSPIVAPARPQAQHAQGWRIAQYERFIAGVRLKRHSDGSFTAETEDRWISVDPRDDDDANYVGELVSVLEALWLASTQPACWIDGGDLDQIAKLGMGGVLGWPDDGGDPRRVPVYR